MENQDYEKLELQTKAFVTDLLSGLDMDAGIDECIEYIVKEIGVFTGARSVLMYKAFNDSIERVYEWKGDGAVSDDSDMQCIPQSVVGEWLSRMHQNKILVYEDTDVLQDTMPDAYKIIKKFHIHTLMLVPVYEKELLSACMVLIDPDFSGFAVLEHIWLFLGKQIGLLYRREKLNHKYLLFMDGIRSSNLSEFIVDYATGRYEAFRVTRVLSKMIPEEGDWNWLRQLYASIIKPEYKDELLRCTEREYMESFLNTEKGTFYTDIEREVDGVNTWFRLEFSVVSLDAEGHLERFVLFVKDISEQKRREEWMQYKIEHDELTGTLNRTAFNRVTRLLEQSTIPFGLVLIDIDRFKSINDTYGHDVGDKVLAHLAIALNENMRTSDKIFRLGGDEFAIIMNPLTVPQAGSVERIIENVNHFIMSGTEELPAFSVSAGVAFSVRGYGESLYRNADKALYRTKETTRRGCTVFEEMENETLGE